MSTRPDLLSDLPALIATAIHGVLPDLRDCRAIDVPFDAAELKRLKTQAPAVLVTRLSCQQVPRGDPAWHLGAHLVQIAAFVVAMGTLALPAQIAATRIAQQVMALAFENAWGDPDVGPARNTAERPLTGKELRTKGLHMLVITWDQPLVLATPTPADPVSPEVYVPDESGLGLDPFGSGE